MVNHEHEENAFHYGERSLHSGEDTARHRERRLEPERRVRQMLVSVNKDRGIIMLAGHVNDRFLRIEGINKVHVYQ